MYKQITIKTLHEQGIKHAEIARQLGCHRNTVLKILKRDTTLEKQTRVKTSIFDQQKEQIKKWLDEEISRLRIKEKLQDEYGIFSNYVNLCIYIRKHFPPPVTAFGVQQTAPGEEGEIDFGYLGMLPAGPNGKLVKTWGFVMVLSYSRKGYYAICYDQKLETLCKELENGFTYFGGVPLRLKIDNMRAAILNNQHYDLQFNQDFLEFANHCGTVIIPCTPYHPEQKGKVESGVKYLEKNFVSGRTFTDDRDIAAKLKNWMIHYANKRVHGTTKKVPSAVFEAEEKAKLQPLPDTPFAFFNRGVRKVALNCLIHFENNYYSVPSSLVGKEVTLRWNESMLRIVYQGEQVALHPKAKGQGNQFIERSHLPKDKIYSESERQARYETKMREIGPHAHEYFRMLLQTKQAYWFQTIRGILGLCQKFENEAVNLSLQRALYYKATDVTTIRHILEKKLYLMEIEPVLPKSATETPVMARKLEYYTAVIYDAHSLASTT